MFAVVAEAAVRKPSADYMNDERLDSAAGLRPQRDPGQAHDCDFPYCIPYIGAPWNPHPYLLTPGKGDFLALRGPRCEDDRSKNLQLWLQAKI